MSTNNGRQATQPMQAHATYVAYWEVRVVAAAYAQGRDGGNSGGGSLCAWAQRAEGG